MKKVANYRRELRPNEWAEPPVYPPKEHPRVLINKDYLKEIRTNIEVSKHFKTAYNLILEISAKDDCGILKENNVFNDDVLQGIQIQAFLYAFNDDKISGEKALNNMKRAFSSGVFIKKNDITRDFGKMIFCAATVYDWCYPLLSEEDKAFFYDNFTHISRQTEIGFPPFNLSAITSHAGEANVLRDQLSAGIAMYGDFDEFYINSTKRIFAEFVEPRNFCYQSHSHHQGDSYGSSCRYTWELWCALIFKRMCNYQLFSDDMSKVTYSWLYTRLPNGQLLRNGDTFMELGHHCKDKYWTINNSHLEYMALYNDPVMYTDYLVQNGDEHAVSEPLNYLLFGQVNLEAKPIETLPLTKYFAYPLPAMVARTSWDNADKNSNAMIVEMKGAGIQFNNHQHLDAGAFQIYYRGYLATDAGSYPSYGTVYDWGYNKRSISHNCMLFKDENMTCPRGLHDGGQRYPNGGAEPATMAELMSKNYANGDVLAHSFGPDKMKPVYSYMKVDLQPAYDQRVEKYERTFCFFNLENDETPGALIVFDRTKTVKPTTKKVWMLHMVQEPEITNNLSTIIRDEDGYSGKLFNTTLLPKVEDLSIKKFGPPEYLNTINGVNYPTPLDVELNNSWWIEVAPKSETNENKFLNVLQVGTMGVTSPMATTLDENDTITTVNVEQYMLILSTNGEGLDKTFEFNVICDNSKVVLTDLVGGSWSIEDAEGKVVASNNLTNEDSVLFAELDNGKYFAKLG